MILSRTERIGGLFSGKFGSAILARLEGEEEDVGRGIMKNKKDNSNAKGANGAKQYNQTTHNNTSNNKL